MLTCPKCKKFKGNHLQMDIHFIMACPKMEILCKGCYNIIIRENKENHIYTQCEGYKSCHVCNNIISTSDYENHLLSTHDYTKCKYCHELYLIEHHCMTLCVYCGKNISNNDIKIHLIDDYNQLHYKITNIMTTMNHIVMEITKK
jgi:hypothetical protein